MTRPFLLVALASLLATPAAHAAPATGASSAPAPLASAPSASPAPPAPGAPPAPPPGASPTADPPAASAPRATSPAATSPTAPATTTLTTTSASGSKSAGEDLAWPLPPLGLFGGVSLRISRQKSPGHDAFSESDYGAAGGFQFGKRFLSIPRSPVSLWAVGGWEVGGSTAKARGQNASLVEHRLTLGIEGQVTLARWLQVYGRGSGVATDLRATMAGQTDYSRSSWVWGGEATAGVAFLPVDGGPPHNLPKLIFALEFGHFWSGSGSMNLQASVPDTELSRWADLRLPALDPSGWQGRLLMRLEM